MSSATRGIGVRLWPNLPSSPRRQSSAAFVPAALPLDGVHRAALRFHASNHLEPLLVDHYSGCFLADPGCPPPEPPEASGHVLATAFIDGRLLEAARAQDELRQVVLLSDGMDTRAYRLRWPRSTLIFDVSPAEASLEASRMLEGVGAKIPRNCMVYHIPSASADLQEMLHGKGFNGGRPSIWILQGLPLDTLVEFQQFLSVISAMAMEGCMFLGELPIQLLETDPDDETDVIKRLNHTFMSHGFRVDIIDYNEIGMKMHGCPLPVTHDSILFVACQLRLSDDQMEKWRKEFQRIEEEGDEEGFEDMIV